ncbi:hypothetical protein U91I_01706 [alpha proteobacterium U9-1i]|nr:hypothetical protein U91I_01706 [alpha proteobacterium U9-1i]
MPVPARTIITAAHDDHLIIAINTAFDATIYAALHAPFAVVCAVMFVMGFLAVADDANDAFAVAAFALDPHDMIAVIVQRRMIGIVEAAVVVAVQFAEHAVDGGRHLGARDPPVSIGIHVVAAAGVDKYPALMCVRLGLRSEGESAERDAQGQS